MAAYSTPAWTDGASPAISAAALTAMGQAIEISEHPYGVCSTAAATAAKTVSINASGISLFTGLTVRVKFANNNLANNPTLNINSLGAIPIVEANGSQFPYWGDGQVVALTYDGTNWVINNVCGTSVLTGFYSGDGGSYGQSNPTAKIQVPSRPLAVLIRGHNPNFSYAYTAIFIQPTVGSYTYNTALSQSGAIAVSVQYASDGYVKYYAGNAVQQLNGSGWTYEWVAIF